MASEPGVGPRPPRRLQDAVSRRAPATTAPHRRPRRATGPGCTKSGASRASRRPSRSARRSTRRGCARAPAGRHSPTKPSSSSASTSSGRALSRLSVPQAPSAPGSPRTSVRHASSSGSASRARERLHPQRGRQAQQRAVDALGGERAGAVGALLRDDGGRRLAGHVQAPGTRVAARERRLGAALQRASSSGDQRCWWTSVRGRIGHRREQSTECLPDLCSIANPDRDAIRGRYGASRARHRRRDRRRGRAQARAPPVRHTRLPGSANPGRRARTTASAQRRARANARYRIRAPNALAASSTASAAVAFSRSRIGLTSTISNEPSRPDSATSSIARCASR